MEVLKSFFEQLDNLGNGDIICFMNIPESYLKIMVYAEVNVSPSKSLKLWC